MSAQAEIGALLQSFQDGYTRRDLARVSAFMELFTADVEMIGTNGVTPGVDEWYMDRASARELVEGIGRVGAICASTWIRCQSALAAMWAG